MFDMKIKFSIFGLIIFVLPMLINLVYFAMLGGSKSADTVESVNKILEFIEQATRLLYAVTICFLVSNQKVNFKSPYLYIGIVFLILYYIVWIRYFAGGMEQSLLAKNFFFIPMPLAIFPVLYFICGALWMRNYIALILMIIFGIAHNIISYINLK